MDTIYILIPNIYKKPVVGREKTGLFTTILLLCDPSDSSDLVKLRNPPKFTRASTEAEGSHLFERTQTNCTELFSFTLLEFRANKGKICSHESVK